MNQPTNQRIPIRCINEDVQIGALSLPPGKHKLNPRTVWQAFHPEDDQWRLPPTIQRAGEYFRCPRCSGALGIPATLEVSDAQAAVGTMGSTPDEKRRAKERTARAGDLSLEGEIISIVLGRTSVRVPS